VHLVAELHETASGLRLLRGRLSCSDHRRPSQRAMKNPWFSIPTAEHACAEVHEILVTSQRLLR
jgi:hypothetical protein